MKPRQIIVVGAIVLVIGAVIGITSFLTATKDPSVEAVETVEFVYPDYVEPVILNRGAYDVWFESGLIGSGDPGDIIVRDSDFNLVYRTPASSGSEKITINNKDYEKDGTFTIENSGIYNVTVEYSGSVLYFTPPIDVAAGLGVGFGGVVIAVLGGIFLSIGLILHFFPKQKPPAPRSEQQGHLNSRVIAQKNTSY